MTGVSPISMPVQHATQRPGGPSASSQGSVVGGDPRAESTGAASGAETERHQATTGASSAVPGPNAAAGTEAGHKPGPTAATADASPADPGPRAGETDGAADKLQREQMIAKLKARDAEVKAHEMAHLAAAGGHAIGGPQYDYQQGPDGKRYAVGGHVKIDTSPVDGDPAATVEKARTIQRAALAPSEPSAQDRRVASKAASMEARARQEMQEEQSAELEAAGQTTSEPQPLVGAADSETDLDAVFSTTGPANEGDRGGDHASASAVHSESGGSGVSGGRSDAHGGSSGEPAADDAFMSRLRAFSATGGGCPNCGGHH